MAIHVHVERITKRPTESRAWPSGVLALNTIDLVLTDVDAIIVKMITTTVVTSKTEAKNQLLVGGVDVAAHADRKLTNLVRCRAETENESQSGIGCTELCFSFSFSFSFSLFICH